MRLKPASTPPAKAAPDAPTCLKLLVRASMATAWSFETEACGALTIRRAAHNKKGGSQKIYLQFAAVHLAVVVLVQLCERRVRCDVTLDLIPVHRYVTITFDDVRGDT